MYSIGEGRTRSGSECNLTNSIYSPPFVLQAKTIMSQAENDVNVTVTIGDVKVEFSGSAETVTASVMNFLLKQVPSMDLARKILLNYAAQELIEAYSHVIKITPEGPRVILDTDDVKLSDKDIVALQLVAARIAKDLGRLQDNSMQVSDIHTATALNPKSISSRISEMVKAGHVARDEKEPSKYRITTAGIHWLNSTIPKKIRPAQ
jgi:predicted transcriptional regulator